MTKILITGATSGLGKALAIEAAKQKYQVIACGRNKDALSTLQQWNNITTLEFDITDEKQTYDSLATVECDIVILNAGTCEYVDIEFIKPELFKRVFDINFFGVIHCLHALLPKLRPGSQIVIIDSLARLMPFTRSQAYGASKAALHYLTKSIEVDLNTRGITIQSVSPGFIDTPLTQKNDFEMPMLISAQDAALTLLKGIGKKKKSIYLPFLFSLILRVMYRLPTRLKVSIAKRLANK